jgi:hypothetical protein
VFSAECCAAAARETPRQRDRCVVGVGGSPLLHRWAGGEVYHPLLVHQLSTEYRARPIPTSEIRSLPATTASAITTNRSSGTCWAMG